MSTAPTTHDTPNENAHRMGAIIKSNRLGSISKTSASATRMGMPLDPTTENAKATAKIFQNASEKQRKRPNRQNRRPPTLITTMVENKYGGGD